MKNVLLLCALLLLVSCSSRSESAVVADSTATQCSEDSWGVVRVMEGSTKHVYRNECFENILIDYGCKAGKVESSNIRCQKGCALDRYKIGRCLE